MDLDQQLVDLLPNYSIIWNRSRKDFRDIKKKENAYKELAGQLGVSVETVCTRYKALREKYRKEKTKMEMLSRSGAGAFYCEDSWELFDSLRFLDGVMLPRKRSTNLRPTLPPEESQDLYIDVASPSTGASFLSPTPASECSELSSLTYATPRPGSSKKRKTIEAPEGLGEMVKSLKDAATSLATPAMPPTQTKYDRLGQFIAATLNEMQKEDAERKWKAIMVELMND